MKVLLPAMTALTFSLAGCGVIQDISTAERTSVRSADATSNTARAVIDEYAGVLDSGSELGLTSQISKKQVRTFRKNLKRCMRQSGALNSSVVRDVLSAANTCIVNATETADIEASANLMANFGSILVVLGDYSEDEIGPALYEGIRGTAVAKNFDHYLETLMKQVPDDQADKMATAVTDLAVDIGIEEAVALEQLVQNLPKRSGKFLNKVLTGAAKLVKKRGLSSDLVPSLQTALDELETSDQKTAVVPSLFENLLSATQATAASTTSTSTSSSTTSSSSTSTTVLAIDYASATLNLTKNSAMTAEDPTAGTFTSPSNAPVTGCTVSPDLPTGLSLNATTCVISGTPTVIHSLTTHTVTASNSAGSATTTIDIVVVGVAFSSSFDLSSAGSFTCDGAGSCATNNDNVTIGGGSAVATSIDLKKNTDAEWNTTGASLSGVTASSDNLVLNSTTNQAWLMDESWTPQWASVVIYYDFEGDAVNVRNPGTYDGTALGNATASSATGKVGSNAATFDGSGDAYNTGFEPVIGASDSFTVMAWVKVTDPSSDMYFAGSAASSEYMELAVHNTDVFRTYLRCEDSSLIHTWGSPDFMTSSDIADGTWQHLAIVWDGSGADPVGKLYTNGKMVFTDTFDAARAGGTWSTMDFTGQPIYVGAAQFNGGMYGALNGEIDEFAYWSTALTDAEVSLIHQKQSVPFSGVYASEVIDRESASQPGSMSWNSAMPFGKNLSTSTTETTSDYSGIQNSGGNSTLNDSRLLAYFNFDGAVGSGLPDVTGNGHNSSSVSGTLYSGIQGVIGNAWRFGEGHTVHGDITVGGKITVSAWILPDSDFSTDHAMIVGEGEDGEWELHYDGTGDKIRMSFDNGSSWSWNDTDVATVTPGKWSHVVVVRDSGNAGDDYLIYVNGTQVISSSWRDGDSIADNAGSHSLQFGGRGNGSRRFSGLMDEVGIWNEGLSAAEILELYQRGANRLQVQMRTCPDATCSTNPSWIGSGGVRAGISEWHNNTAITSGDPSGNVNKTAPFFRWTNFPSSPSSQRYWQYRLVMESMDEGNVCSGSTRCNPALVDFSLHDRVGNVASGAEVGIYKSGYFVNTTAVSYVTLTSIAITDSGTCTYQFSPDNGTTFYHHNGTSWVTVSSDSDAIANDNAALSSVSGFPAGSQLVIKAFTGSACSITGMQVNGTL